MGRPFSPQLPLMAAAALGVSSAVFLDTLAQLTSPSHLFIYHFSGRPSAIFVAAIADGDGVASSRGTRDPILASMKMNRQDLARITVINRHICEMPDRVRSEADSNKQCRH